MPTGGSGPESGIGGAEMNGGRSRHEILASHEVTPGEWAIGRFTERKFNKNAVFIARDCVRYATKQEAEHLIGIEIWERRYGRVELYGRD
jgi:hypothetical protein